MQNKPISYHCIYSIKGTMARLRDIHPWLTRIAAFLAFIFVGNVMLAERFEKNGFNYEVILNTYNVSVSSSENVYVYVNLYIPDKVVYNGLEYTVTDVGDFSNCRNLMSVTFPATIRTIGSEAFKNCDNLKKVTFSSNVGIGSNAFIGCYHIDEVHIPDVSDWLRMGFGNGASNPANSGRLYVGGSLLTELVVPEGIDEIRGYAFRSNSFLKSVVLSNTVTRIGEEAFSECRALTTIDIPGSLAYIAGDAFSNCEKLEAVRISDLAAWCRLGFEGGLSNPLYYAHNLYLNDELVTDIVIPEGIVEIKDYAFAECKNLTSVVMPYSVAIIGKSAFSGCKLSAVRIPDGTKKIDDNAFNNNVPLKYLTIGQSVEEIGMRAFLFCNALEHINVLASEPPALRDEHTFGSGWGWPWPGHVHVPKGCRDKYAKTYWGRFDYSIDEEFYVFPERITILPETNVIKQSEVIKLEAEVLPDSVSDKTVIWKSSDDSVATVDRDGVLRAVAPGEATITATAATGLSASMHITVEPVLVESISLSESELKVVINQSISFYPTFKYSILPSNASNQDVEWLSTNPDVGTVDGFCRFQPRSVGETDIVCKTTDGTDLSATCHVTVIREVKSIRLSESSIYVDDKGPNEFQLEAEVFPYDATFRSVEWKSTDEEVATVDQTGLVTVHSRGNCGIRVCATDGSGVVATCRLSSDYSSVEGVVDDGADVIDIYSIDGVLLHSKSSREMLDSLSPGIYIIHEMGKYRKILVQKS